MGYSQILLNFYCFDVENSCHLKLNSIFFTNVHIFITLHQHYTYQKVL